MYRRLDSTVTRLETPICLTMAGLLPIFSALFRCDQLFDVVLEGCNYQRGLAKQMESSILFFAREAPEAWLRNYLTSNENPENHHYQEFGYEFYWHQVKLIRNFVCESRETQTQIISFVEELALGYDQEWIDNLIVLKDFVKNLLMVFGTSEATFF